MFAGNGGRGVPAKSETLGFRLDRLTSYTALPPFSRFVETNNNSSNIRPRRAAVERALSLFFFGKNDLQLHVLLLLLFDVHAGAAVLVELDEVRVLEVQAL